MSTRHEIARAATSHINPFGLRMQPELREQLERAAVASGRSLNAEIVARLQESFEEKPTPGLRLYVLIDSQGYIAGWPELQAYLHAIREAGGFAPYVMESVVVTPDMKMGGPYDYVRVARLAEALRAGEASMPFQDEPVPDD